MSPQAVAEVLEAAAPPPQVRIAIDNESDVLLAGKHGRRLASSLDFSPTDVTVIATAIMEVARNVLRYARRGDLLLHLIEQPGRVGLAIVARDKGPGIADVSEALRDGKGLGLATVRRLMDEVHVRSEAGRGTTVIMRKWTHRRQVERAGFRSEMQVTR
ncbi:MAG: ATP-binding protein [Gemmatimonadetes bacterium]|nr:MAG: ATP-binding protein [Gemmatimonadota bacterium]